MRDAFKKWIVILNTHATPYACYAIYYTPHATHTTRHAPHTYTTHATHATLYTHYTPHCPHATHATTYTHHTPHTPHAINLAGLIGVAEQLMSLATLVAICRPPLATTSCIAGSNIFYGTSQRCTADTASNLTQVCLATKIDVCMQYIFY